MNILSRRTSYSTYTLIIKFYGNEKFGYSNQKMVRENYHYFVVMDKGELPSMVVDTNHQDLNRS